jgi:serralysin
MATVSDVTTTPLSGLNHIDALLDSGPDWNYLSNASNTLRYTFSVASGNEVAQAGETLPYNGNLQAFTAAQQAATRTACRRSPASSSWKPPPAPMPTSTWPT